MCITGIHMLTNLRDLLCFAHNLHYHATFSLVLEHIPMEASKVLADCCAVFWLNAMGHSINQAVNGDRNIPLPLFGEQEQFYRWGVA
jgi:hypothetical protein